MAHNLKTAAGDVSSAGSIGTLTAEAPHTVKLGIYIGRFSPFHLGHANVIKHMCASYDYQLVIIGSANQPRTIKNPFTAAERAAMIQDWVVNELKEEQIWIDEGIDVPYNDTLWLKGIETTIMKHQARVRMIEEGLGNTNVQIVTYLTGSDRDDSTYYLTKYFNSLKKDLLEHDERISKALSATIVRDIYFGGNFDGRAIDDVVYELLMKSFLPASTWNLMERFRQTQTYHDLAEEYHVIEKGKKAWANSPYPPTFMTVDAVVVQSGHVLMVKRRGFPGRGQWALPGGFVNQNERLFDAVIRELMEETQIQISPGLLKGSYCKKEIFDHPGRSLRGRTFSMAYLFKLPDNGVFPNVKAADDAADAKFISLAELATMQDQLFEDHASIIDHMISSTKI